MGAAGAANLIPREPGTGALLTAGDPPATRTVAGPAPTGGEKGPDTGGTPKGH